MLLLLSSFSAYGNSWPEIRERAKGQTVYWNAWGGSEEINAYISWVGSRVKEDHGVTLKHVKLASTADAVSRVLAEKAAGRSSNGSVDLIWINGENFAAMRESDLLFGPFTEALPNFALTNAADNPEVVTDFTLPTEGFESPWGKAQITFYYDSAQTESPPQDMPALLTWARANPGQFSYPRIPDFTGSTFLKQALIELTEQDEALYQPVAESDFEAVTAIASLIADGFGEQGEADTIC